MEQLNNERELTREERLEIEEKAIQALVNMGVKFNVPLKINRHASSVGGISIFRTM